MNLTDAIDEGRNDPIAVTELATILAKDWCEQWGGWPDDIEDQIFQIWSFRQQARKLLSVLTKPAPSRRRALASAMCSR